MEKDAKLAAQSWLEGTRLRFLIFRAGDGLHLVLATGYHEAPVHSAVAKAVTGQEPSWQFVGAGYIGRVSTVFNSDSCEEEYGYDRPADEQEQEALIASIETALKEGGIRE